MSALLTALCCICGNIRTCRRPRNYRRENYWLRGPIDNDWHRETGELKCAKCGRDTTHAILLPDDIWREHAERIHREAIGYVTKNLTDEDRERIQTAWRQGLPRNPIVRHHWWIGDETKAREAGQTHLLAICKEPVPVPQRQSCKPGEGVDRDELIQPRQYGDVEYEDPRTGLSWYVVHCTDCLLRSNEIALQEQRKALRLKLLEVATNIDTLDAPSVAELMNRIIPDAGLDEVE